MGKIFGISNNPVSTIGSALVRTELPQCPVITKSAVNAKDVSDKFVAKNVTKKPNYFVKMRNGFGKLMSHFSKAKTNKIN